MRETCGTGMCGRGMTYRRDSRDSAGSLCREVGVEAIEGANPAGVGKEVPQLLAGKTGLDDGHKSLSALVAERHLDVGIY